MKTFINYLGQLRVYSLVDLILLLIAAGADSSKFIGVFCFHVGFLAYLESRHAHSIRVAVPKWVWPLFLSVGLIFYRDFIGVTGFLVASYCYTKKTRVKWGMWAPFFRGIQMFFLVFPLSYPLSLVVFAVFFFRNAVGDTRDIVKDMAQEMKTLPMILDMTHDFKRGHLVAMIVSTSTWWSLTNLPLYVLLFGIFSEIASYNLTQR